MELDAQQISILLNVPFKTDPIPLDLDAIHHPDLKSKAGLSKYPYITPNVKYTFKMMKALTNSGYSEVISFFFDKNRFQTVLYKYSRFPDKEEDEQQLTPHTILQYNATIMLKMIFPTYYPSVQNVSSSMEEYILQKGSNPSYKTLFGFNKMSYVKIDGKIHTITKTLFLNDFFNHPVYKNVIKRSIDYFAWSSKQGDIFQKEITNGLDKLKKRIHGEKINEIFVKGNLNIEDYISSFAEEIKKYDKERTGPAPGPRTQPQFTSKAEDDKRMFSETVIILISVIEELYREIQTVGDADIYKIVDSLYETINNIKEIYTRVAGYNLLTKTPIEFVNRVNRMLDESKKLSFTSKIWNNYIKPRNINVRIEDETPEILNLLRSKYKPYIDYVDVIRTIIKPSRETSNAQLQECINNYSQNRAGDVKLSAIIRTIHEKYMVVFGDNPTPTSKEETIDVEKLIEYMNVGVCSINLDEQNKPRYEIQVSMNLIENEYTMDSINEIKCIYDGFVLGKQLEDHLDDANPYESVLHTLYVSQEDIDSQKNGVQQAPPTQAVAPPPSSSVPKEDAEKKVQFVGGRKKSRKLRKTRRKTRNRKMGRF